jgi:O-methyltransferase
MQIPSVSLARRLKRRFDSMFRASMRFPSYPRNVSGKVQASGDPVRYASIALAIQRIQKEGLLGAFAEAGVWRGDLSRFVHSLSPERKYYLFDTFGGFPAEDLPVGAKPDGRFRDTDVESVRANIRSVNPGLLIFKPGRFPDTACGLEHEQFAFVMLDFDLYAPTVAALEFFYPRLVTGGYMFLHDYNSPESSWAVARAVDPFLKDKPELLLEVPDRWGSVVFRKL